MDGFWMVLFIKNHFAGLLPHSKHKIAQERSLNLSLVKMEKEIKVPTEDSEIDLFEDDDEFKEFEINEDHVEPIMNFDEIGIKDNLFRDFVAARPREVSY